MGQIIRARAPIVIEDYGNIDAPLPDPAFRAFAPWVGVPIWRKGEIIGTFGIGFGGSQRPLGAGDVHLLEAFAHHAAIALENALLHRETRTLSISAERNRIAREMHDTIAQTLATLRLEVQPLLARAADATEHNDDLLAGLRRIDAITVRALDEVRRSIWALQPEVLEGTSLEDALRATLDAATSPTIEGRASFRGIARALDATLRSNLFLVAQEAIVNARKHAAPKSISLTLEYRDADIELTIQDDGHGFDPDAVPQGDVRAGFGIASMRDRMTQLGGGISVASAIGVGTRVRAIVPYKLPLSEIQQLSRGPHHAGETPRPAPRAGVRVALIDDHALVRQGIRRVLDQDGGFEIVAEAGDALVGLRAIEETRPAVVLLDVHMPGINGLELLRRIQELPDPPAVVMLTMALHDEVVFEAIRGGARGYLIKDGDPEDLLRALRIVAEGGSLIAPAAADRLAERLTGAAQLTAREREILALVARGLRNKEIAAALSISEKTVQFHMANLFDKLGVDSRVEAVRVARERGLVLG
jgi:DNA-binding NarL/FixJ family response regulator/signal transduction histidine kinase